MKFLLLTLGLLLVLNPCEASGQKPLRVLVDASKDGGLWWFPQSRNFDPTQYHQGKLLADFMREKRWDVVELGRGDVITSDKLRDVDLIVRPPIYFDYTPEEIIAYRDSVMSGTRLLLMGGSGEKPDALATLFGLRFDSQNRFARVRQWIPHPLAINIAVNDLTWTSLNESPPGAVLLAWVKDGDEDARPVLGYLPYGNGYVVFVGQAFLTPDSFSAILITSLGSFSPDDMKQLPVLAPVAVPSSAEVGPPLLEPVVEATLPQPEVGAWRFDWEDAPGAKAYEIVILGPAAIFPAVKTTTTTSDYVLGVRQGYIADHNLRGWSWRVRAQHANDEWGPWSSIRRFNIMPMTRRSN